MCIRFAQTKLIGPIGVFGLIFLMISCANQTTPSVVELQPTVKPQSTIEPQPTIEPLNGNTLALAWTYQADGPLNDTLMPVGEILIAIPTGGSLLALDIVTGKLHWQYDPPQRLWERSYASDGQRIFVGVEGGRLVALNAKNGKVVWQKELGINVQIAPLVVDNVLYVPTTFVGPGLTANPDGKAKLFALAPTDGSELWSVETDNYILQTPFFHNDALYIGGSYYDPTIDPDEGGPMRMYALSAQDGSSRWTYESEDGFVKAVYATDNTVSFIAYQDFTNGLSTQDGTLLWRKDTSNWVPSLSGVGDTVYFGSANTVAHALDMNTGQTIWTYNIGGGSFNYMLGAPVQVLDDLYFLTQQGNIIALNATDGTLQWQISTEIVGSHDGLSISDGWLFIGDAEGNVYAYTNRG